MAINPATAKLFASALGTGASLVSPFMDAFGNDPGEFRFLKTLEDMKIKDPEIMKKLMKRAGMLADRRELGKDRIAGSMTAKGLEGSIIGEQAGLQLDKADNKALLDSADQFDQDKINTNRAIDREMAEFRLGQAGARRQGRADFFGNVLGGGSKALFGWLNK